MKANQPRYPTLTQKGFLSKRGHDLNPQLIELLNEIISQMPHGLPLNKNIRSLYAKDLYMQTFEGAEGVTIPCLQSMDDKTMRELLYNTTGEGLMRLITRANPENPDAPRPYLERYPIFETPELLAYVHHFRMSDDEHIHNHPWRSSYSTILAGNYTEMRPQDLSAMELQAIHRPTGSFGSLTSETLHRVVLPSDGNGGERSCWTFFMHYRHWENGWGFIEEEPFEHQVWDDLINNGQGGNKKVPAYAFVPKEVGASPKDWWNLPDGPKRFIDQTTVIRERFGLCKESYL